MSSVIDEQFAVPRRAIGIVALPNSDQEAVAIRALLEAMDCAVSIHWIGAPADFLTVLSQGATAPRYLLISGHGDEDKGYYFGDYAPFVDTSMLRDQHLPASAIAPVVNLPNCTVISSACAGGVEAMGRAFVSTGRIRAYMGCRDYPNGTDMLVFLVNFFQGVLRKELTDGQALQRAMAVTDQPEIFEMSLFLPDATVSPTSPTLERD